MTPHPTMAQLGGAVVKRPGAHRWFIWFPREGAWLSAAHLRDRGAKPWLIASRGAPRWV